MALGILYSAIAKPNAILVSSQRSLEDFETKTKSFLNEIPVDSNIKTCFKSDIYFYHVLVEDMLIYLCVAETDFGRTVPYAFLNEIKKRFTSGSLAIRAWNAVEHEFDRDFDHVLHEQMVAFSSEEASGTIGKVRGQVNEVMCVMNDNIQKVVERGEKLETLIDKTSELEISSNQFRSTSKKIRNRMWCKNVKVWFVILILLCIIVTIIALIATNVIDLKN